MLWHPFTQHHTELPPIALTRAQGAYLYDTNNKRYIDAISSWWTTLHGHAHSALVNAVSQQMATLDHVMFAGFTHAPAQELAQLLVDALSQYGLSKVFFSDNGSTAVEVALKMALQRAALRQEPRHAIVAFEGGYHGDTFGAMAAGKGSGFFEVFNTQNPTVHLLPFAPTHYGDMHIETTEQHALHRAEQLFATCGQSIAALLIEPLLQGAGGMRMCRPQFLRQLYTLAKQHDILFIVDEVATGFYRTGTLCAFEQADIQPDIVCLAKGLTGGVLPLSVTMTQQHIYDTFLGNSFAQAFVHGHSYTANAIACAAAVASFKVLHTPQTQNAITQITQWHQQFIGQVLQLPPAVQSFFSNIRQQGTVLAFDIATTNSAYGSGLSQHLRRYFLAHGINLRPLGNTIYLLPPYCLTRADYDDIINVLLQLAHHYPQGLFL